MTDGTFSPAYVGETVTLTFDFVNLLGPGETLSGTPTFTVNATQGLDGTPSGIINGTPQISGTKVLQSFKPKVAGEYYDIICQCSTSSDPAQAPIVTGLLPAVSP